MARLDDLGRLFGLLEGVKEAGSELVPRTRMLEADLSAANKLRAAA